VLPVEVSTLLSSSSTRVSQSLSMLSQISAALGLMVLSLSSQSVLLAV
jgi:hypothetical protein